MSVSAVVRRLTPPPIQPGSGDATTALTLFLFLLLIFPSALRLPALGGVGYPAAMFAFGLGLWWCWSSARGLNRDVPINPVKVALFCFVAAVLCAFGLAMRRALPAVEASQATIGILRLVVIASVVLVTCDGIPTWERLLVLIRRIAIAGGLFALLGLAQFFTQQSLIGWISLPGFSSSEEGGVFVRSGFARASGTATHPLEYAAALAVFFPIALTIALFDRHRHPIPRYGPAIVLALTLVLSGSRSGFLGLLIGVVVLAVGWPRRLVLSVSAAGVAMMVIIFITIPGMLGTIRGLFLSAGSGSDPSTVSRSNSYALVQDFFLRDPLFGRGFGTFLPTYRILDNQILLLLIDVGLVGLLCFAGLAAAAAVGALAARAKMPPGLPRQIGQALCSATVASFALMFFFDALGFPISGNMFMVAVGLCGAYWRMSRVAPPIGDDAVLVGDLPSVPLERSRGSFTELAKPLPLRYFARSEG